MLLAFEASTMSDDGADHSSKKRLKLLAAGPIDLDVVEGLRLAIAFRKIRDPSKRRAVIELAERLADLNQDPTTPASKNTAL